MIYRMQNLIPDAMVCISNFLELKDIYAMSKTSKHFSEILNDQLMWKFYYYRIACNIIGNNISIEIDDRMKKKPLRFFKSYKNRVKIKIQKQLIKKINWSENDDIELRLIDKTLNKLKNRRKILIERKHKKERLDKIFK